MLNIRLIILVTVISSCGVVLKNKQHDYLSYSHGKVFFDNYGSGVYIPKEKSKSIVYLRTNNTANGIAIQSEYPTTGFKLKYTTLGKKISNEDSLLIDLFSERESYPMGFVIIQGYLNGEKKVTISYLSKRVKLKVAEISEIKLSIMGHESINLDLRTIELKDTLMIGFDYLKPKELETYTFITDTIGRR